MQVTLQFEQTSLVTRFHQLADQCGGGGERDREAFLAGRQAEREGDMGLAGAAKPDRLGHGDRDDVLGHGLHQPQHLDEVTLAAVSHAPLERMAQRLKHLRQVPALQGCGLVERVRLGLYQCQVMQRIGDKLPFAIGARVPGDDSTAAQDHDLVDEALHHDILEAIACRHGIVVAAVAEEGGR